MNSPLHPASSNDTTHTKHNKYIEFINSRLNDTSKHILVSASATCVAEVATLPLCTLKTNYQNTNGLSIVTTFKTIWSKYGICGFYNASGWAIASQMLSTATKYTWYQTLKDHTSNKFVAGISSGLLTSLITHPIDVIKIHYQMHKPFIPELRIQGIKLLYRGYSKTLSKASIGSLCFFPLYDTFNGYMGNASLAAMTSAIVSTTIMQPVDYMKTRQIYGQFTLFKQLPTEIFTNILSHLQRKSLNTDKKYELTLDHIGNRLKPYFKGLTLNLARIVPHFVITMTLIDSFNKH